VSNVLLLCAVRSEHAFTHLHTHAQVFMWVGTQTSQVEVKLGLKTASVSASPHNFSIVVQFCLKSSYRRHPMYRALRKST